MCEVCAPNWRASRSCAEPLEISELALQERQGGDRRGLGTQYPRTQAHGGKARRPGEVLFGVGEAAFRPDEHRDVRDGWRNIIESQRGSR